jgi:hypothetical protein
MNILETEH